MMYRGISISLLLLFVVQFSQAQFEIQLEEFSTGFVIPVDVVHDGTDKMYVVEKLGTISVVLPDGQRITEKFLDISDRVNARSNEMGLLGMAFHPDYENNGFFYVNYTDRAQVSRVSRFSRDTLDPLKADPDSEVRILSIPQPFTNHNGGDLAFGPDGYLYCAFGDGGSANDPNGYGQNMTILLGKMLRIDVDNGSPYGIPADNPFVGDPNAVDEIWASGLRNPWKFSFDRSTGDMWIGDVGQNKWEEIDFEAAGSPGGLNYGWKCYEGNADFQLGGCGPKQNYTFPIWEYDNNKFQEGCSITGGYVYRGMAYPKMLGWYLYADYCSGNFWALNGSDTTNIAIGSFGRNEFATFGEDITGELYVAAIQEGTLYKIKPTCVTTIELDKVDQQCPGVNDGSVDLTLNGPTEGLVITWSNGEMTEDIDSLAPGTYYVVIEGGGCNIVDSIVIEERILTLSCLEDLSPVDICENDTFQLYSCIAPQGYSYDWYKDSQFIANTTEKFIFITESGKYAVSFNGECDLGLSIERLITVHPQPDRPEIVDAGRDSLMATGGYALYEWFLNGVRIVGSADSVLTGLENGLYSVVVTSDQGCVSDTSDTFLYDNTLTFDLSSLNVLVFPNPMVDRLSIIVDGKKDQDFIELILMDKSGRNISSKSIMSSAELDISGLAPGIYFLEVNYKNQIKTLKLVK